MKCHFKEKTLDDLTRCVIEEIVRRGIRIKSGKGHSREIAGVLLELDYPRSRLSLTEMRGVLFSSFGEWLWYLSGSGDLEFIQYYIRNYDKFADDGQIYGAYGPRLSRMRGVDQLAEVVTRLQEHPTSRRAVLQLFNAEDIAVEKNDVPCTCILQFLVRDDRLHLITYMRSNDVILGLPHDVFSFTMIQEYVARQLSVSMGSYKHCVGSLHLYDRDGAKAKLYLSEGWQSTLEPMPPMPRGDPRPSLKSVLRIEAMLRNGESIVKHDIESLEPYWRDVVLVLMAVRSLKLEDAAGLATLRDRTSSPLYAKFMDDKIRKIESQS